MVLVVVGEQLIRSCTELVVPEVVLARVLAAQYGAAVVVAVILTSLQERLLSAVQAVLDHLLLMAHLDHSPAAAVVVQITARNQVKAAMVRS